VSAQITTSMGSVSAIFLGFALQRLALPDEALAGYDRAEAYHKSERSRRKAGHAVGDPVSNGSTPIHTAARLKQRRAPA
jgi:hypothetical protein